MKALIKSPTSRELLECTLSDDINERCHQMRTLIKCDAFDIAHIPVFDDMGIDVFTDDEGLFTQKVPSLIVTSNIDKPLDTSSIKYLLMGNLIFTSYNIHDGDTASLNDKQLEWLKDFIDAHTIPFLSIKDDLPIRVYGIVLDPMTAFKGYINE